MLFGEVQPERVFDHGTQADTGHAGKARTELGVEEGGWIEAHLTQAGQILARGVQYPLLGADGLLQLGERADRGGIEEKGAGTPTEDLDQVGPLRVTEPTCSLGIHRDGAGTSGEQLDRFQVLGARVDDVRRGSENGGGHRGRGDGLGR